MFASIHSPSAHHTFCRGWPDVYYGDHPHVVPTELFWRLSDIARRNHGPDYGYRTNTMEHRYMDKCIFPSEEAAVKALQEALNN